MNNKIQPFQFKGIIIILISIVLFGSHSFLIKSSKLFNTDSFKITSSSEERIAVKTTKVVADVIASILWLKVDTYFHFNMTPGEVMPFIRIVTLLNPEFLEAWTLGTHLLCNEYKDNIHYKKAIKFIDEAIEKNKKNPAITELYFEKAWSSFFYGKEFHTSLDAVKKGIIKFNKEDETSICLMTNNLKLLTWNLLLLGQHQAANECIKLLLNVYPESINMEKSILSKLYNNYNITKKSFNFKKIVFKGFLKKNMKSFEAVNSEKSFNFVKSLKHHPLVIKKINSDALKGYVFCSKKIDPYLNGTTHHSITNQAYSWINISKYLNTNLKSAVKINETHHSNDHQHHHHHHHHGKLQKIDSLQIFIEGLIILIIAITAVIFLYGNKKNV